MEKFLNVILLRNFRVKRLQEKLTSSISSEGAEEFLQLLLNLMSLVLKMNKRFRKNIRGFNARYLFRSRDDKITVAATFGKDKMKVKEKKIENTNVTITFKNPKAMMNYLLSSNPDILGSILKQEVTLDGNLNYLYKFAYMSRHLQLMVMPG